MARTRKEHLNWCKKRANQLLNKGDVSGAWKSMVNDLNGHDETREHYAIKVGLMRMAIGDLHTPEQMRTFIEGFD